MAEEPEDLTLRLLREIRAKQDDHGKILERLDHDFQEMRHPVIYSLGLGTTEHLKNSEQDRRLDEQKTRIDELFDKLEELLGGR